MAIVIGIVVARRLLRFRPCCRHILLEKNTFLFFFFLSYFFFFLIALLLPICHFLPFFIILISILPPKSLHPHTHTLVCPNECTNFLVKLKGFQPMFFEAFDQICLVYGYCRAASWKFLNFGWKPHTIPMQNWHIH